MLRRLQERVFGPPPRPCAFLALEEHSRDCAASLPNLAAIAPGSESPRQPDMQSPLGLATAGCLSHPYGYLVRRERFPDCSGSPPNLAATAPGFGSPRRPEMHALRGTVIAGYRRRPHGSLVR